MLYAKDGARIVHIHSGLLTSMTSYISITCSLLVLLLKFWFIVWFGKAVGYDIIL